jgi:hypothetical protein
MRSYGVRGNKSELTKSLTRVFKIRESIPLPKSGETLNQQNILPRVRRPKFIEEEQ